MTTEENQTDKPKKIKRKTRLDRIKEECQGTLKCSFIFFSALHISKIAIAGFYLNECPGEPEIPLFLLILGILGMVTKLISLFKDCIMKFVQIAPILSFMSTAELAIFIVASYNVYKEYEPNYDDPESENYCNKTLYLFSFIYVTIMYALLLLIIVGVGCFVAGILVMDKYVDEVEDIETEQATDKN